MPKNKFGANLTLRERAAWIKYADSTLATWTAASDARDAADEIYRIVTETHKDTLTDFVGDLFDASDNVNTAAKNISNKIKDIVARMEDSTHGTK